MLLGIPPPRQNKQPRAVCPQEAFLLAVFQDSLEWGYTSIAAFQQNSVVFSSFVNS